MCSSCYDVSTECTRSKACPSISVEGNVFVCFPLCLLSLGILSNFFMELHVKLLQYVFKGQYHFLKVYA